MDVEDAGSLALSELPKLLESVVPHGEAYDDEGDEDDDDEEEEDEERTQRRARALAQLTPRRKRVAPTVEAKYRRAHRGRYSAQATPPDAMGSLDQAGSAAASVSPRKPKTRRVSFAPSPRAARVGDGSGSGGGGIRGASGGGGSGGGGSGGRGGQHGLPLGGLESELDERIEALEEELAKFHAEVRDSPRRHAAHSRVIIAAGAGVFAYPRRQHIASVGGTFAPLPALPIHAAAAAAAANGAGAGGAHTRLPYAMVEVVRPAVLTAEERAVRRSERERMLAEALQKKRLLGLGPGPGAYDHSARERVPSDPSPWARSTDVQHGIWAENGLPIPSGKTTVGDPAAYAPINHEMGAGINRSRTGNFMFESAQPQRPHAEYSPRVEAVPNLAQKYRGRPGDGVSAY